MSDTDLNGTHDAQTNSVTSQARVRYKFGDNELEAEGPLDFVNKQVSIFAQVFTNVVGNTLQIQMVQDDHRLLTANTEGTSDQVIYQNDAPPLGGNGASEAVSSSNSMALMYNQPADLILFYRKFAPTSQVEQVLAITYFYHKYRQVEQLTLDDYQEAYSLLQRVPVEKPGNLKSSVRNVVDRTKYLRNGERGKFMLTIAGEELVENKLRSQ